MEQTFNQKVRVLKNQELVPGVFLMRLEAPEMATGAQPGRFVMLGCGQDSGEPLLKRPFSIHDADPATGEIAILYRVVGRGTELLSRLAPDAFVEALGPLGRGFDLGLAHSQAFVAGGGMGIAPLLFLARRLKDRGVQVAFLHGARTRSELLPETYLATFPGQVMLATDDGSAGVKGLVTQLLGEAVTLQPAVIYACGPRPMLRAVHAIAERNRVACQASLEEKMACGLGACMGCATKTASGDYARVCAEGPVFMTREIEW